MYRPVWLLAAAVSACTPSLNWREVGIESTELKAMLPCKPDTVERKLPFAPGREWTLHATGCAAGPATFAILHADVGSPTELGPDLAQWRAASLASLHAQTTGEVAYAPRGALALPQSVQVRAEGRGPDGVALQSQAAYFARGTRVFQAAVYAPRVTPEMAEPFFAGLRFE